jgi:uncharacterized Zn-binding protein involved in type VI secretion
MPNAARLSDQVLHDAPHCHAPIHPPAPTPTPVPHPPIPLPIVVACIPTVMVGGLPAAVVSSQTIPCIVPPCIPAAPGIIAMGSFSVLIGGLPAARVGDMVTFPSCVAPIPSPTGRIIPPGAPTVIIGG